MASVDRALSKSLNTRLIPLFIFVGVVLGGCTFNAPSGPPFKALENPSGHEALIYVYRPPTEKFGYDRTYYLFDSKNKLTDLLHGGYFPFYVKPGKVNFLADVNRSFRTWVGGGILELAIGEDAAAIEIQANVGETYYVEFHPVAHFASFEPTLTLVSKEKAYSELSRCKLLSANTAD